MKSLIASVIGLTISVFVLKFIPGGDYLMQLLGYFALGVIISRFFDWIFCNEE